jgi:predicted transport protein
LRVNKDQLARVKDKKVLNQINDLRDQVIAIDGNIKETYRKGWIQFKTSIRFCGINPYQKSFTLSVRIPKSEIKDPKIELRPVKGRKNWSKIKIYPHSNITSLIDIIKNGN